MIRAGIIQTRTGIDPGANAKSLAAAVDDLAGRGAEIVFTPEMCGLLDRNSARLRQSVRDEAGDPTLTAMREAARRHGLVIAIGSLAIRDAATDTQLANRSFVIGQDGEILARYDKMHLFDVTLPNGEEYRESRGFRSGDQTMLVKLPMACLGLTICYDLRFPQLHAALARSGAQIIAQPASFTVPTGQAHWHVLLRARAIETGAFVIAAAQSGQHEDGRQTYGHSLVVNPWGEVILDMGDAPGTALVEIDLDEVTAARARIPSLQHARPIPAPQIFDGRHTGAP